MILLILNILLQAIKIIILLGVLVIIHEGGHFFVAKFFKIPVKEFAVGFGKKLWSKEKNGTLYSIRIFPLGGFVDIDDEKKEGSFAQAPLYQKNLILVAGAFVNFLFAIIFGFIVLFSRGDFVTNRISTVNTDAPIFALNIQQGDKIYKINGKRIYTKNQIDTAMYSNEGEVIDMEIKKQDDSIQKYQVNPYMVDYAVTGFSVNENNEINYINESSDINTDKISMGDKIVSINNITVTNNDELSNEINKYIGSEAVINIERNGSQIQQNIQIDRFSKYYIGVNLELAEDTFLNKAYYSFIGTGDFVYETFKGMVELITGQSKNAELMGIIGVSQIITETSSIIEYLGIMVSVSLSLAIVNLFPLPLLDGGKIVLFTIEKYRKKEFSERFIKICTSATIGLLALLTIYVMIKDIIRIV